MLSVGVGFIAELPAVLAWFWTQSPSERPVPTGPLDGMTPNCA